MAIAFSPDGEYVVGGTSEGRICIWGLRKYKMDQPTQSQLVPPDVSFSAHIGTVFCLVFSEDRSHLISGGDDNIRIWDWATIKAGAAQHRGTTTITAEAELNTPRKTDDKGILAPVPEINGLAIAGSQLLYSAAGDGIGYVWDLAKQRCISQLEGHTGYLHCIGVRKNGMAITGSEDGTVKFWDPNTAACSNTHWHPADEVPDTQKYITCLAIDPDDNWLVCGGGDRQLLVYHLQSATCTAAMPTAGFPQAVVFNAQGEVVSGGSQGYLHVWSTGGELKSRAATTSTSVFSVATDPTSKIMAAGGTGGIVDIFIEPSSRAFSLSCDSDSKPNLC